jgi:hypothetical protein
MRGVGPSRCNDPSLNRWWVIDITEIVAPPKIPRGTLLFFNRLISRQKVLVKNWYISTQQKHSQHNNVTYYHYPVDIWPNPHHLKNR